MAPGCNTFTVAPHILLFIEMYHQIKSRADNHDGFLYSKKLLILLIILFVIKPNKVAPISTNRMDNLTHAGHFAYNNESKLNKNIIFMSESTILLIIRLKKPTWCLIQEKSSKVIINVLKCKQRIPEGIAWFKALYSNNIMLSCLLYTSQWSVNKWAVIFQMKRHPQWK